jgi:hypothetical protein
MRGGRRREDHERGENGEVRVEPHIEYGSRVCITTARGCRGGGGGRHAEVE